MTTAWGSEETRFFYELTPEIILDSVESSLGVHCTGRVLALNSMENRVYEVEIDIDDDSLPRTHPSRFVIIKFYRPGRWSKAQVIQEHEYMFDLVDAEIPVVAPFKFKSGESLGEVSDSVKILFAIFPKRGGRSPHELMEDQASQVGRLIARMHGVGALKTAPDRVQISEQTYGLQSLDFLLKKDLIDLNYRGEYEKTALRICELVAPLFKDFENHRIHGDCHLGNLLWADQGPFWVDFDDMLMGPAVQDLWLMIPGRDHISKQRFELLLEGYEMMRPFNRSSLILIEPLRALRFMHFSAWIGKRFEDPAFQRVFEYYGSPEYWRSQLMDLKEQQSLIESSLNKGY